jgi:hypothetical protein
LPVGSGAIVVLFVLAAGLLTGVLVGAIRPIGPRWEGVYIGPALAAVVFWSITMAALLRFWQRRATEAEV